MEQIEYILHPDGRIEERVTGMAGGQCTEVTRSIEEALGHTACQQWTSEYFQQAFAQQPLHHTFEAN